MQGDMRVCRETDLRASGGSLQPARLRCRNVPARLRKSCSAAGAARDFLGWKAGEVSSRCEEAPGSLFLLPPVPLTCGRRRSLKHQGS